MNDSDVNEIINIQNTDSNLLLNKSASELLKDFGAGKASPGSGSAAALLGLLSAQMIKTVCKLSKRKTKDSGQIRYFERLISEVENNFEPRLKELFEKDAIEFHQVIELRKCRDKSTNSKESRNYSLKANKLLEQVTDYTFEIAEISLHLMDFGKGMLTEGWGAIKGDSGVAISSSMASVTSCIFIINLNLKTISERKYAKRKIVKCQELQRKLMTKQADAFHYVNDIGSDLISRIEEIGLKFKAEEN